VYLLGSMESRPRTDSAIGIHNLQGVGGGSFCTGEVRIDV
jgi:hypothetical protein